MKIINFIIDNKQNNLVIEFSVHESMESTQLSFEYLRISSPVSAAKNIKSGDQVISHKKSVVLISIESVAKHGYRFIFNDGHNAIYSEAYIHELSLEYEQRWQVYLTKLKASGHSREAMIDITQL